MLSLQSIGHFGSLLKRILILLLLSLLAASPALAAGRVALVIGNGDYKNAPELNNPVRDARAVAAALRRLGFTVLDKFDVKRLDMEDILGQFGDQARAAEVALVFYAGHGIQMDGRNYLLPVDASLEQERDLRRLIPLDDVLKEASHASRLGLVILDSCRDNPFTQTLARSLGPTRSVAVGRGLARIERTPAETLVAFATRDNTVAADGVGEHSPFTAALLKHLETPGLDVRLLFGKVRDTVLAMTNRSQEPYIYGSLGGTEIYLSPPAVSAPVAATPPAGASSVPSSPAAQPQKPVAAASPTVTLPSPFTRPPEPVLQPGRVFRDTLSDGSQGPEMVVIPAGTFLMGSPASDERQHPVSVKSFAIGKYEVTFEEYDRFAEATGREKPADEGWGRGRQPVINVNWSDVDAYAKWLSQQTGQRYRLPTEAEWEYAARAGTQTAYWWGVALGSNRANCAGCGSRWDNKQTAPVGSFSANPFGLYDTAGNVWEWTCSEYDQDYRGKELSCTCSASSSCVWRGGSWYHDPNWVRGAARLWGGPRGGFSYLGFRLARD
jgi:formylglycine-generating enzyme required for sulfatase activity